jgi:hypothetical protein
LDPKNRTRKSFSVWAVCRKPPVARKFGFYCAFAQVPRTNLKNQKVKNWTIWTTFGSKFPVFFFTGLGLSEGCRRLNRAAATPIGQQNQPGHLKLSVLDGKTGKYTDFGFAKIKPNILDAQFVTLCVQKRHRAPDAADGLAHRRGGRALPPDGVPLARRRTAAAHGAIKLSVPCPSAGRWRNPRRKSP